MVWQWAVVATVFVVNLYIVLLYHSRKERNHPQAPPSPEYLSTILPNQIIITRLACESFTLVRLTAGPVDSRA